MAQGQRSAATAARIAAGIEKPRKATAKDRAKHAAQAKQLAPLFEGFNRISVKDQAAIIACRHALTSHAVEAVRYLGGVVSGSIPVDKSADRIRACAIVLESAGIIGGPAQQSPTDAKEINEMTRAELAELAREGMRMLADARGETFDAERVPDGQTGGEPGI